MARMSDPFFRDLPDLAATEALGRSLARVLRAGDALLLEGPLGAGKTSLARALLREACGDPLMEVPSPSYTLVQTYETPAFTISHFDLWRLDGPGALVELGWEDARDGVVLVEWPDRLGLLAPPDALRVDLSLPEPARADGEAPRRARLSGWEGRFGAGEPVA